MMQQNTLTSEIDAVWRRARTLHRQALVRAEGPDPLVEEALEDLYATLEELQAGEEELQAQRRALAECTLRFERQLQEAEAARAQTRQVLEGIAAPFFVLDRAWRFVLINHHAEAIWRRPRAELLGRTLWEAIPGMLDPIFQMEFRRAILANTPVAFETLSPTLGRWIEVHASPSSEGISVFFQDISERRLARAVRTHWLSTRGEDEDLGAASEADFVFAHVIADPLEAIALNAALLRALPAHAGQHAELVDRIDEAVRRIQGVLEQQLQRRQTVALHAVAV